MTIEGTSEPEQKATMPIDGNEDIPEEFTKSYPSQLEAKKIKKPLMCYLLDIDTTKKSRPTLVTKPIKIKYGQKWFKVNDQKYFVNYSQIMNFGKYYAYLCQYGNPVGALSFYEYPESLTDANQVEMMVNQHAVEVFKKHKGMSTKLAIALIIMGLIGIVALIISVQLILSANNAVNSMRNELTNARTTISTLTVEKDNLKAQLENNGALVN